MKALLEPIDKELIKSELTSERFLRKTNKANNEIYVIDYHNSPNTIMEVARLREMTFRESGGGSGEPFDLDFYDKMDKPYQQLIVWNPQEEEIIGGYRFIHCKDAIVSSENQPQIVTEHLFHFSDKFMAEYMPYTLELGRAYVQPKYQNAQMGIKSLFALDNLWDGIGALVVSLEDVRYMIGKVTIFPTTAEPAVQAMVYFLEKYFPDPDKLILGKKPLEVTDKYRSEFDNYFTEEDYKDNYRLLNSYVKSHNETIPPLIHAYTELSSTMRTFKTCVDVKFGNIIDTGMMITVDDIHEAKRQRYVEKYIQTLASTDSNILK